MNYKHFISTFLLMVTVTLAIGQVSSEDICVVRTTMKAERKAVFEQNMDLNDLEATSFWILYDNYVEAKIPIIDKRIALVQQLEEGFVNLSEEELKEITDNYFSTQMEEQKLNRKFANQISKNISAQKAMRFLQIEVMLESIIRQAFFGGIPLIGDDI